MAHRDEQTPVIAQYAYIHVVLKTYTQRKQSVFYKWLSTPEIQGGGDGGAEVGTKATQNEFHFVAAPFKVSLPLSPSCSPSFWS